MVEIYRRAFRHYWSVLPVLLALMAVFEGLIWYLEPSNPTTLMAVPLLIVLYQFHRHFLFGEYFGWKKPPADAPPQKFGWFMLISLALLLVPVGLALIFTISVAPHGAPKTTIYGLMIVSMAPLYLISLSLFGTALPASVAQPGNFRMSAGMRTWLGTMWRLILGPGVLQIVVAGLILGMEYLLRDVPAYHSTAGQLAGSVIARTLGLIPSLPGVAVLCHMYEKVMAAGAARQESAASHP